MGGSAKGGKVVLLIRGRKGQSAEARWSELRRLEVFACFPPALLDAAVSVVEGDVALPGCGLSEAGRSLLSGVTVVVHCAASVKFDLPLDQAAATNIGGALRVQVRG
mgnify:CR=1 FL=1